MKSTALLCALLATLFFGCSQSQPEAAFDETEQPTATQTTENECGCAPLQRKSDECSCIKKSDLLLKKGESIRVNVVGQGVSPVNTTSPAQAYALAKRAAITDAYRLLAEKVKGVDVEGQDVVKNMMVKRSTVRTYVDATIRNANIIETTFKEGLCEVEMEVVLYYKYFLL